MEQINAIANQKDQAVENKVIDVAGSFIEGQLHNLNKKGKSKACGNHLPIGGRELHGYGIPLYKSFGLQHDL